MKLSVSGTSHQGLVRAANEDAFRIDEEHLLFIVADGLGGLPDGALASQMAVDVVHSAFTADDRPETLEALQQLMRTAHAHVFSAGREKHPETGIGTTLTIAMIRDGRLLIGHSGDSAAFRWRRGRFEALTEEHTLAALYRDEMTEKELPAYFEHTLTQCLGMGETFDPELRAHQLRPGDRFLFCTDGVTKPLATKELEGFLKGATTPQEAVQTIEEAVLAAGAPDNLTLIALFHEAD